MKEESETWKCLRRDKGHQGREEVAQQLISRRISEEEKRRYCSLQGCSVLMAHHRANHDTIITQDMKNMDLYEVEMLGCVDKFSLKQLF